MSGNGRNPKEAIMIASHLPVNGKPPFLVFRSSTFVNHGTRCITRGGVTVRDVGVGRIMDDDKK